jgi:hypothetical protein
MVSAEGAVRNHTISLSITVLIVDMADRQGGGAIPF